MMLLLRDRLIITFKEIDITLNRMFRTALRRARNYVTFDFAIRGGYRIIIFISIYSEFPISNGFITSSLNGKERKRIWIQVNHLNHKQNCDHYLHIFGYTYFLTR